MPIPPSPSPRTDWGAFRVHLRTPCLPGAGWGEEDSGPVAWALGLGPGLWALGWAWGSGPGPEAGAWALGLAWALGWAWGSGPGALGWAWALGLGPGLGSGGGGGEFGGGR